MAAACEGVLCLVAELGHGEPICVPDHDTVLFGMATWQLFSLFFHKKRQNDTERSCTKGNTSVQSRKVRCSLMGTGCPFILFFTISNKYIKYMSHFFTHNFLLYSLPAPAEPRKVFSYLHIIIHLVLHGWGYLYKSEQFTNDHTTEKNDSLFQAIINHISSSEKGGALSVPHP